MFSRHGGKPFVALRRMTTGVDLEGAFGIPWKAVQLEERENLLNRRRQLGLVLTVALGFITVALGFWGYSLALPELSPADELYRAIQLLTLEGANMPHPNWQINVARFLAAITLAFAVIGVLMTLAREQADRIRVRFASRGQYVIAGFGDRGRSVANRLSNAGTAIVVVDSEPGEEGVSAARSRNLPIIIGDAREAQTFRDAGVDRASQIFICLGDDSANLEALEALIEALPDSGPCIHVALDNHLLWRELHRSAFSWEGRGSSIEFISLPDRVANRLVEEAEEKIPGGPVLVWGIGPKAVRTAVHAVHRSLLAGHDPQLVLAGPDADELRDQINRTDPWINVDNCFEAASAPPVAGPGTAFVVGLPQSDALAGASALAAAPGEFTIVAEVSRPTGGEALRRSGFPVDRIRLVDAESQVLGSSLFERSAREVIARARHAYYVDQDRRRGKTPAENPSMRPWEELPESLRESNRLFADSVGERLTDLGATLVPLSAPLEPVTLSPGMIDDLARTEHQRWRSDLEANGWRHRDAEKDPARKLHPLLVDWDRLDEAEREKDRDSIRALPELLARVGYELRFEGPDQRA